jgi:hypothetical protein
MGYEKVICEGSWQSEAFLFVVMVISKKALSK